MKISAYQDAKIARLKDCIRINLKSAGQAEETGRKDLADQLRLNAQILSEELEEFEATIKKETPPE